MSASTGPLQANKAGYSHLSAQNWRSAYRLPITHLVIRLGFAYNGVLKYSLSLTLSDRPPQLSHEQDAASTLVASLDTNGKTRAGHHSPPITLR